MYHSDCEEQACSRGIAGVMRNGTLAQLVMQHSFGMWYHVVGTELAVRVANMLQLLTRLREGQQTPLLVFVDSWGCWDSFGLLGILQHWGRANFNPLPKDVVHIDAIFLFWKCSASGHLQ